MIDVLTGHGHLKTSADVKVIKMKDPGISRYLLHLFMLILTTGLATSTGTSSFWKQKALVSSKNTIGQIPNTEIPELSEFTACLDTFYENDAPSTAFSYCVHNGTNPELGFSRQRGRFEVFHLGKVYEVNKDLEQNAWHTVCINWKRQDKELVVYVNKTRIYNATTEDRVLRGNGSLVLGAQHTNTEGRIDIDSSSLMYGELYNYQMWNYTRSQEQLLDCIEGNLLSWTKETWTFTRIKEDVQLRCANATLIPTPTESTTTQTTTLDYHDVRTTPQAVTTSPTTKSITPSTVTVVSSASSSSSSSTHKTSIETYSSPLTVINSSSTPSPTPNTALSGVTESSVSILGTTYITSASSKKPTTVIFYMVQIKFTTPSPDVMDEDMASSLIQSMMDQLLNNTEFAAVQITVSYTVNPPAYIAKSIVRANSSRDPELLADELRNFLLEGFTDPVPNTSIIAQNVTTDLLELCMYESTSYDDFLYQWPDTNPAETATLQCHTNPDDLATRECYINAITLETEWGDPNYSECVPNSFEDLENVIVTPENANNLAMQILNMTKKVDSLPRNDIRIILNKVSEIIALGEIDLKTAKVNMDVINLVLLRADTSMRLFTNKILNLMEEVGFKMTFPSDTANVMTDSMALLVSKKFEETYFTVSSYMQGIVEISLEQFPPDKAVAFIHLPDSIQDQAEISSSKVQFNFIGNMSLFQDKSSHLLLNTYVISASFEGNIVENLVEPINITLRHLAENVDNLPVTCAFWNFTENDNMGGWDTSGCLVNFTKKEYTSCSCNHLTHFGVLLDISRTSVNPLDEHILSLLTYVGCGIAAVFLGVSLVTYGTFRQLRRDYPSKILMNFSFSLLMLNLLFLINNWLSSFRSQGLCVATAALLHYFLLTSFTWMGLEAVHMYFAFVKVFNSYIHKYILKLCIAGWGIPLVVVVAVLSVNVNFYGNILDSEKYEASGDNSALFCWIQNDIVFYVTVVSYFGVIFLINISMFVVVILQIKSLKTTRIKDWKTLFMHDIKSTLSLAFLLGLTWGFVFFAWGPVRVAFLYLFAIFNTLQGFFIFVFHCLIKENVRRHWKMYLCCGRCRLDNYSDWSRLSNVDAKYNCGIHLPSDSYQSTRSNNTASTSNASSLSSLSRDALYGRSFVNGGGIFISSAHTAPSYHATVYPNNKRMFMDLDPQ